MPKPEIEFTHISSFASTPLKPVSPSSLKSTIEDDTSIRILSRDPNNNDQTSILTHPPGSTWGHPICVHGYWEEALILEGRIYDETLKKWFGKGSYCCRPPWMKHGPYKADEYVGCEEIVIWRYPRPGEDGSRILNRSLRKNPNFSEEKSNAMTWGEDGSRIFNRTLRKSSTLPEEKSNTTRWGENESRILSWSLQKSPTLPEEEPDAMSWGDEVLAEAIPNEEKVREKNMINTTEDVKGKSLETTTGQKAGEIPIEIGKKTREKSPDPTIWKKAGGKSREATVGSKEAPVLDSTRLPPLEIPNGEVITPRSPPTSTKRVVLLTPPPSSPRESSDSSESSPPSPVEKLDKPTFPSPAPNGNAVAVVSSRQSPTGAVSSRQSPTRAVSSRQSPTRALSSRQSPTRALSSRQSPTRAVSSHQSTTGSASSRQSPTRSASSRQSPTRSASSRQSPTRAFSSSRSPTRSVSSPIMTSPVSSAQMPKRQSRLAIYLAKEDKQTPESRKEEAEIRATALLTAINTANNSGSGSPVGSSTTSPGSAPPPRHSRLAAYRSGAWDQLK